MAEKVIINDQVIDKVLHKGYTVDEALAEMYEGIIADKVKDRAIFGKMTPTQIALADAGITKKSTLRDMATYTTQEGGEWLFPATVESTLHEFVQRNQILQYMVKSEDTVNTMVTQSTFLDMRNPENKKNAKLARVSEGADLPLAVLTLGQSAITLHKYGRAVEQTYEAAMMMRVDMFTKTLEYIAQDVTDQEVEEAARICLVGDGNKNPAKSLLTTKTKDVVAASELTDALFQYWFETGLIPTTIVAGPEMFKSLSALVYDSKMESGASNRLTLNTPQIPVSNLNLICARNPLKVSDDNVALILNDQMSLTKHTFAGSLIQEMSQNIRNQTKLGTISEITGFSKNMPDGVMVITSGKGM